MKKIVTTLLVLNLVVFELGLMVILGHRNVCEPAAPILVQPSPVTPKPLNISVKTPSFLTYTKAIEQMKRWEQEAPDLVEIQTYGKTSGGTTLTYLRLNHKNSGDKPKVLVMASIHGNEPLASSCCMAYIGNMLSEYGISPQITKLIDERDIYFVPVVSPDSFPKDNRGSGMQRYIENVDPNRDFPTKNKPNLQSVPTVSAVQDLCTKIGFNAAISGHTWGRVLLKPWGDSVEVTPNDTDYQDILGKMSQLSGYKIKPASAIYGKPIIGTEVDWFYRHEAFAIVIEYGTHQQVPTMSDIENEFNRTYPAVLVFIESAPQVTVKVK